MRAQSESGQRLHNRYLFTDIGGVELSKGLGEGRTHPIEEMVKVTLLDKDSYNTV
jgi:hypothetical protein